MVSVEGLQIVHNTKTTDILLDVQFILFLQQQIYLLIDCCLFRLVNQFVFLSVNQLSEVGTGHMLRRNKHVPSGSTHVFPAQIIQHKRLGSVFFQDTEEVPAFMELTVWL